MGDDIASVRSADIYDDLDGEKVADPRIARRNDQSKIKHFDNVPIKCGYRSMQNATLKNNSNISKSVMLTNDGKKSTSPTLFKCLTKSEENIFNVVANRTMLETEVWKTQMALYDELIDAEVKEREEKLKQVIKYEELLNEVEKLKFVNVEKETKINELLLQNTNLKKNICSLYKTAKTEIERKDCLLHEANTKLDSFQFYQKSSRNSLHENQAPKSNVFVKEVDDHRLGHKRKNDKECENSPKNKRRSSPYRRRNDYRKNISHTAHLRRKSSIKSSNQIHTKESKNNQRDLCFRENLNSQRSESRRHRESHFSCDRKLLDKEDRIISLRNKEPRINNLRSSCQSKSRQFNEQKTVDISSSTDILALRHVQQNENFKHDCVKDSSLNSCKNNPDLKRSDNLTISHDQCSTLTDTGINKNDKMTGKLNCLLSENDINKNTQNQSTHEQNISKTELECNEAGLMSSVLSLLSKQLLDPESSTIVNGLLEFEQNENSNFSLSLNEENKDNSKPEKTCFEIFKDETTTNALFFGLIPIELRQSFMEYETRQTVMMNKLKQSISNEFIQSLVELERNNILTMNKLKQTFVNYFFSHEKDMAVNSCDSSSSNIKSLEEKEQNAHKKKDTDSPLFFFEPPGYKSSTNNVNTSHASSKSLSHNETMMGEKISENGSNTVKTTAGKVETSENKSVTMEEVQVDEIVENESVVVEKMSGNEPMIAKKTIENELMIITETAANDMVVIEETARNKLISKDKMAGKELTDDKTPGNELTEDIITGNEIMTEDRIVGNKLNIGNTTTDELMIVEEEVGNELMILEEDVTNELMIVEEADGNERGIQNLCHSENNAKQCDDIFFLLNSKSKNISSQDDDSNTDSTKEIPTVYRKMFQNREKSVAIETINVTRIENTALAPAKKINNVDSTYSQSINSSSSSECDEPNTNNDDEEFHTLTSNSKSKEAFHPSLNSVYYRRQLLKAALEEKAANGLSKRTKENVANLYKFRKDKVLKSIKRKPNILKKTK